MEATSGWTSSGSASIGTIAHGGNDAAVVGISGGVTNGDSTISQTFTAPTTGGTLSFWYRVTCKDLVKYDWVTPPRAPHLLRVCAATPTAPPPLEPSAGSEPQSTPSARPMSLTCTRPHHAPSTEVTEYACPDQTSLTHCQSSDVSGCTPTNRERSPVPPGGKCTREAWSPEAKRYELGDSCAPVPKLATAESPKGSACIMESGPGAYCSHDCSAPSDCADLVRAGFAAECFGGGCMLTRK